MHLVLFLIFAIAALVCLAVTAVVGLMLLRLPAEDVRVVHWRQIAKRYRAELSTHGWWRTRPKMTWRYREALVTIAVPRLGKSEGTRLTLRHAAVTPDLCVGRLDFLRGQPQDASPTSLVLSPELRDTQWSGWSADPPAAQQFLTPVVQLQLLQLHQAVQPFATRMSLQRGLLQIEIESPLASYDSLQQLIRTALAVYDQLLLASADGIRFVEPEELAPLEDVVCRVCGEPILNDLVVCRTCKTPHHAECWEYVGQCSTYACGERMFVVPRSRAT